MHKSLSLLRVAWASLLLASVSNLDAQTPPETIKLRTGNVFGLIVVPAKYRGRTGWFVLATERTESAVSDGFEKLAPEIDSASTQTMLDLDGMKGLGKLPSNVLEKSQVFGVLGRDFFRGKRIEFDLVGGAVTIEPSDGKPRKGDTQAILTTDGNFGFEAGVGSQKFLAFVATGQVLTRFQPSLTDALPSAMISTMPRLDVSSNATEPEPIRLTEAFRDTPIRYPWLVFDKAEPSSLAMFDPRPQAMVAATDLGSAKLTLDYGARTIAVTPLSEDLAIGSFVSRYLLNSRISLRDGKLWTVAGASPFPEKEPLEIVEIGGIPISRVLTAFRGKGEENGKLLAELALKARTGQKLIVLRKEERVELTAPTP